MSGCEKGSRRKTSLKDEYGEPGPRCISHGGGLCSVSGCEKAFQGKVSLKDEYGGPG